MLSEITNFGGRVVSLWAPDTQGNYEDIVLGYENLNGYLQSNETYFGALIGRYGNRIGKGEFQLNGQSYKLRSIMEKTIYMEVLMALIMSSGMPNKLLIKNWN